MTVVINGTSGITDVNGTAAAPAITGTDTDTGVFFGTNTVSLSTGGTERLQVDSSGNLGLGVTPSAWTRKAFQLSDAAAAYVANNSGGATVLATNMYFDGSNKYATSAAAARYSVGAGTHEWYTAASGTAGNAISFTQAMTLDASGNLGVGTTSPSARLHATNAVVGITYPLILSNPSATNNGRGVGMTFAGGSGNIGEILGYYDGTDQALYLTSTNGSMRFNTASSERMRIDSSGRLLVNTTSGTTNALFQVSSNGTKQSFQVFNNDNVQLYSLGTGTVYSNGGVFTNTNPSDERLKDEITDLSFGLQQILALRPVSYKWKNDRVSQGTQYGFIAQEVQTVMPELVREFETTDGEETVTRFGLEKEGIYAALVKAIQEQQAIIETLTSRIAALESK